MILVETCMLPDYIGPDELVCVDPFVRNIEKSLYEIVRHADEIGDDIVVDPWFRIPWVLEISDYGVPIEAHHATTLQRQRPRRTRSTSACSRRTTRRSCTCATAA